MALLTSRLTHVLSSDGLYTPSDFASAHMHRCLAGCNLPQLFTSKIPKYLLGLSSMMLLVLWSSMGIPKEALGY